MKRLVAWLLHVANSGPPFDRERFYALKDRLLRRYGQRGGDAIQRITKTCYACEGTGIYLHEYYGRMRCNRCWNGIYQDSWIRLETWHFGRYTFHRPIARHELGSHHPDRLLTPDIVGTIEHKRPRGHRATEAYYWLLVMFDRPGFLAQFGHIGHGNLHYRVNWVLPLCIAVNAAFWWIHRFEPMENWHNGQTRGTIFGSGTQEDAIQDIERHQWWRRQQYRMTAADYLRWSEHSRSDC